MIKFLTTATSGSQSLLRILSEYSKVTGIDLELYRGAMFKSFKGINNVDKFVVNVRDPRDVWCNQYYWLIQHPAPNEEAKLARRRRYDRGIDASVLASAKGFSSDMAAKSISKIIEDNRDNENIIFVSYAQLCVEFDLLVQRLNNFFGVEPTKTHIDTIYKESPKSLNDNKDWIGNQWQGCDIMPGRYKSELKLETIDVLNSKIDVYLDLIKQIEVPKLKYLYE